MSAFKAAKAVFSLEIANQVVQSVNCLGGPCKYTVWLGSIPLLAWLHYEYHNCCSNQTVQKGFLELTKWCTRQTKWCAPLQKGLARTLFLPLESWILTIHIRGCDTHITCMHAPCSTSSYTLQLNKEAVKEKEEVLIWRDHYTVAVLQCLMNISNSAIPSSLVPRPSPPPVFDRLQAIKNWRWGRPGNEANP